MHQAQTSRYLGVVLGVHPVGKATLGNPSSDNEGEKESEQEGGEEEGEGEEEEEEGEGEDGEIWEE